MTKYVIKHDTMGITTWPNVQLHMQPTFCWVGSLLTKSNIWGGPLGSCLHVCGLYCHPSPIAAHFAHTKQTHKMRLSLGVSLWGLSVAG